jgi:hypothetical protein
MAIKGLLYTKTTWDFEERPVKSSKLNSWDDRIEAALELSCFLLAHAWGGGNGVVRGAAADDLKVAAQSPVSMTVQVKPGYALIKKFPFRIAATVDAPESTAPLTHPRIDLVQASLETWGVSIKQGAEAAVPTAPAADTDCIPLAQLYLRPGMASIKNTDDATNGYIIDARVFL